MRLDFNVLWFDDQSDAIKVVEDSLRPRLYALGFDLKVAPYTDFSDVQFVGEEVRVAAEEQDIDLILLDFDLGQGRHFRGNDLARTIRFQFPYKDIIFYSGHGEGIPALRSALFENRIDGAYLAMRDQLPEQAFEIIQNLIKKVVDLDHMRGIVMAETSELDDCIADCLAAACRLLADKEKAAVRKYAISKLEKSLKGNSSKIARLADGGDIGDVQALGPGIFSSYHCRLSLNRALEVLGWSKDAAHAAKFQVLSAYQDEVAAKRDVLAHAMLAIERGEKVLRGKNGVQIFDEDMVEIRGLILKHRANIQSILSALNGVTGQVR